MISISFALGPTLVTIYIISKTVFGYLYPIAQSCRAILDRNAEGYHQWLTYWMVFFCMRFIEGVVDLFFSRLPGYRFFKLAFIIWLVLPRFKGAALIYHGLIHKHLEYYERDIDGHLVRISKRAQETAWTVGQTVVKETSTVVARAATSMVISPTAASLIQQAAANGGVVGSGEGAAGTFAALSAVTAFAGAMGAASSSCPSSSRPARPSHIEVDDTFGQPPPPRPPQQQDTLQRPSSWTHRPSPSSSRLSRNLPSPVGATQTQLLADIVKILEDGIFVHISTAINHNTNQQASPKPANLSVTSLHLLRLSTQRRALIYDQVSDSRISTLPLLRILAVRAGSSDTALELVHLPTSIISEGGEEEEEEEKEVDSESFWKGKRKGSGGGGGMTRVLLINVETPGDRDLLLTGFVMMMRKAREPYQLGSRRLRLCLLRQFLKRWKTCAGEGGRIKDEEKEGRGRGWEKGRGEEEMTEVEEEEDGRSHVSSSSTDNDVREWISSSDEKSPEKSR